MLFVAFHAHWHLLITSTKCLTPRFAPKTDTKCPLIAIFDLPPSPFFDIPFYSKKWSLLKSMIMCYFILYYKSLAARLVLLNFHHHLSCWITFFVPMHQKFQLRLCFHLFCTNSSICCICLGHFQKKCKLTIWPPLYPPNIWESNGIMLSFVWIIYPMLCLVVAWYWFWIFELDPRSWPTCICNITKSDMILNSG